MDGPEAKNLQDFLTNFQFPWEHEHDEILAGQTPPCRHAVGDTTPARRGRRLSAKVLLEEFSGSCTTRNTIDRVTDSNLTDGPSIIDLWQESEDAVLKDDKSALLVKESDRLSHGTRKGRGRRSSQLKRRESIALLEIIGEFVSPNTGGPTPPHTTLSENDVIVRRSSPGGDDLAADARLRRIKKAKAKSSRRRSTRLSRVNCPLLELGDNGIPKLVRSRDGGQSPNVPCELGVAPKCDPRGEEERLGSDRVTYRMDSQTTEQTVGCSIEACTPLGDGKNDVGHRLKLESPLTPLQTVTHGSRGEGIDCHHTPFTPDDKMEGLLHTLQQHPEAPVPCRHTVDEAKGSRHGVYGTEVSGKYATIDFEGELNLQDQDSEAANVTVGPGRTNCAVLAASGGTCSTAATETDKENITFRSEPCEYAEVDQWVKDLYMKKGEPVSLKTKTTNLETVFEELRQGAVGIGRRKYRRSLAFPNRPWEARKGTKGNKRVKRKRMSLCKISKNSDPAVEERLADILRSLADDPD